MNKKISIRKILPIGVLFFAACMFLINCAKEDELHQIEAAKKQLILKSVPLEKAKQFFNNQAKSTYIHAKGKNEGLIIEPIWESVEQKGLSFTEALLTDVTIKANIELTEGTKLFFIQANDSLVAAIRTNVVKESFDNGSIKTGKIFFHDLEGKFLDAYIVKDGELINRLAPKRNTQQASFLTILLLQEECNDTEMDLSNLGDNNCFQTVDLGTISSDDSGGGNTGGSSSNPGPYPVLDQDPAFTANNNAIHHFLENGGISDVNGGGSGNNGGTNNNSCPNDRIYNNATKTCDCKDGKVETSSGSCIEDPCKDNPDLIYNSQTGNCDCKERNKINVNGVCVTDNPCNKIKQHTDDFGTRQKLIDLKNLTHLNYENSFSIFKNGSQTRQEGVPGKGGIQIPSVVPSPYVVYAHNHDSYGDNGQGTFSVFSLADLIAIADILDKGNLNLGTFIAFLATNDNTQYALRITNAKKFQDLFFAWVGAGQNRNFSNPSDFIKFRNSINIVNNLNTKYFDPTNSNALIKTNSNNNVQDLISFLKLIKEGNMGLTMYELNPEFTSIKEVKLNNNNTINRIPCN